MTTHLEHNGKPCKFSLKTGLLEYKNENGIVPLGEMIELCAWCSSDLNKPLFDAGYSVSHGICESCEAKINDGN